MADPNSSNFSSVVGFPATACVIIGRPSFSRAALTCRAKVRASWHPLPNRITNSTPTACVSCGVSFIAVARAIVWISVSFNWFRRDALSYETALALCANTSLLVSAHKSMGEIFKFRNAPLAEAFHFAFFDLKHYALRNYFLALFVARCEVQNLCSDCTQSVVNSPSGATPPGSKLTN